MSNMHMYNLKSCNKISSSIPHKFVSAVPEKYWQSARNAQIAHWLLLEL